MDIGQWDLSVNYMIYHNIMKLSKLGCLKSMLKFHHPSQQPCVRGRLAASGGLRLPPFVRARATH